jgi:hypothetical protein
MDGFSGPFDKRLSYKGRALPTPVNPGFLSATLSDGRDTAILLYFGGAVESIPVFTEGGKKSGCEDDTGTRQGSEQRVVRQFGYELGDRLIELFDEFDGGLQLCGKSQSFEGVGINDGGVVSQRSGGVDRLDTGLDEMGATDMVFAEEAFQRVLPS